jgi:hypothetical protein
VFEPIDEYKGDLARTYFYMATRYENIIGGWYANASEADDILLTNNTSQVYETWFLNLLIKWHNQDPVSTKEINRNNAIYALQNNRNPFIDSPQWVRKIWSGAIPSKPNLAASNLAVSSITNNSMQINWTSGNGARRLVVMRASTASNTLPSDSIYYNANSLYGNGSDVGAGNFAVYNGTGSNVTVTGLSQNTTYYITVYEYNGWMSTSNYQTTGALTNNTNTLPVTWLSFTATFQPDRNILLEWKTASEHNNNHFDVERSLGDSNFIQIGQIPGSGNSNTIKSYTFTDDTLTRNSNAIITSLYYRLKQVDNDGKYSYSSVEAVTIPVGITETIPPGILKEAWPNPFNATIYIRLTSQQQQSVVVHLQDIIGKTYAEINTHTNATQPFVLNNLHDLPAGMYFLSIRDEETKQLVGYTRLIKNK